MESFFGASNELRWHSVAPSAFDTCWFRSRNQKGEVCSRRSCDDDGHPHDPIPGPPSSRAAVHSVVKCKRHRRRRRRRRLRAPASCARACARLGGQKFNYLERPPPPPRPPRPSTASALCKKFPSHLPPSLSPLCSPLSSRCSFAPFRPEARG